MKYESTQDVTAIVSPDRLLEHCNLGTGQNVTEWQRDGKFITKKGYYLYLIGDEAVKLNQ